MAIVVSKIAIVVSKAILATPEIANGFGEIAIVVSKMAIVVSEIAFETAKAILATPYMAFAIAPDQI